MRGLEVQADMRPVEQHRFSTRQKRSIDYSGMTGSVRLNGDIGTFMPLFKAGEVLGVGKNTVFGFGEYQCNVMAATSPSGLQP